MGGCVGCQATLAAYNAHPSTTGFWLCGNCVDGLGYESVEQANADIFGGEQ
jgi:hypothetical protein